MYQNYKTPGIIRRFQNEDLRERLTQNLFDEISGTKTEMQVPSQATKSQKTNIITNTSAVQTRIAFEDFYYYLDSISADTSSRLELGELTFSIVNYDTQATLQNVISMKINEFYFPQISTNPTLPDYFFFRRALLKIDGVGERQALQLGNNSSAHFELNINNANGVAVLMQPINKTIYFRNRINTVSLLTFTFINALTKQPIALPRSTLFIVTVPNSVPARFTILNGTTKDIGNIGAQPGSGVAAYLQNFNSPDVAVNQILGHSQGFYITNIVDNLNFEVGAATFATFPLNLQSLLIIAKNRIAINAQITTVREGDSNFIQKTSL